MSRRSLGASEKGHARAARDRAPKRNSGGMRTEPAPECEERERESEGLGLQCERKREKGEDSRGGGERFLKIIFVLNITSSKS